MKVFVKSLLILAFVVSSTAYTQLLRGFGIKGGATMANQTWEYVSIPDLTTNERWGITGSAFVELLNLPYLSLLVETQYTQKGMTFSATVATAQNPDGTGQIITKRPRIDYLSIPILAKMRLTTPVVTPYLIAGPRCDFLLTRHGEGFQAVIDDFKSSELGATFGAGAELEVALLFEVLIEFRYNANFEDAYKTSFLRVRNHTLDFMLGVRL